MFVSLLLFVIGCVDGAWYGTVNSDGSETIVDDSESLHDVMVQQLLNMSFSMDEIQYLYPKPDAEEASSSLGLYSSHLDGRKKRSLYTNMNEAQVHLITNQGARSLMCCFTDFFSCHFFFFIFLSSSR
jgi:hypothetical protein